MTKLSILGATGSIGTSALEIVRQRRDEFDIVALTAGSNEDSLKALEKEFAPSFTALACNGEEGILEATMHEADIVLVAISGVSALKPSLQAIAHTKRLAIANKECLVSAGEAIMTTAKKHNCEILPVDSEHNALFQILNSKQDTQFIRRIILTASGGPFRNLPLEDFEHITIQQALKHPNWSMGKKNTIDSATMMNKGLEVIEAHHLFGVKSEKIETLIHPQSLVHALVEYNDGCMMAHLSPTDMKVPIAYALDYPNRKPLMGDYLDLASIGALQFTSPDSERFPCLDLARQALAKGGAAPAILNAANEVAVDAFLLGNLDFCGISQAVRHSLETLDDKFDATNIEAILETDRAVRQVSQEFIEKRL